MIDLVDLDEMWGKNPELNKCLSSIETVLITNDTTDYEMFWVEEKQALVFRHISGKAVVRIYGEGNVETDYINPLNNELYRIRGPFKESDLNSFFTMYGERR